MKARFVYGSGDEKIFDIKTEITEKIKAYIPKIEIQNVKYIDFAYDYFCAKNGDEGYFITDFEKEGTVLTRFTERQDACINSGFCFLTCYGWKKKKGGILGIVTGMPYDFETVLEVKGGKYSAYLRFLIDCDEPYEDIAVEYYNLKNGSYSEMANVYRNYQIKRKNCVSLKERAYSDKRLEKAVKSIEIRVRQGWKPVPSPVEYQTPETEPPMHVACDFERVGDIANECKKRGIENAEFCLVGWNKGGHDGRFPQIFPPDERLGGEIKLKELISKLHHDGYLVVCHDDATGAYTIADCFDEEYLLKNRDGSLHKRPYCWGGGRPIKICPKRQYERFEISNQIKLSKMGFEGIHYIDVITILPLLKCYDKNHPLNRKESAEWYIKIMKLSRKNFGGFASESGYDFGAAYTDYVLYPSFSLGKDISNEILWDEIVPFWHIVYHGIILYNAGTYTLNYAAKGVKNRLKSIELGGRPLVCYYANFASDNQWMGKEDFICDTNEQLKDSVRKIKIMSEDYKLLEPERFEFIINHERISDGIYCTTYSNNTKVTVDYNKNSFEIKREK